MQQYLDLMRHVMHHGVRKDDRTGTGTCAYSRRCDINNGIIHKPPGR